MPQVPICPDHGLPMDLPRGKPSESALLGCRKPSCSRGWDPAAKRKEKAEAAKPDAA